MKRPAGLVLSLAFALVALCGPALAQTAATLSGAVSAPLTLDAATLKAFPPTAIDITFQSGSGTETGHYSGVLLWTLLQKAGLVNAPGKKTGLRHTLLVTGRDGYGVALALGEIDPNYAGKSVILAFDGGTPPVSFDHLRLLVPGDAHGGRIVKDVATIEVQ